MIDIIIGQLEKSFNSQYFLIPDYAMKLICILHEPPEDFKYFNQFLPDVIETVASGENLLIKNSVLLYDESGIQMHDIKRQRWIYLNPEQVIIKSPP